MWRTKPTTSWTPRTPKSTSWTERTKLAYLIQEALWKLLTEDWWWILLEKSIYNEWNTPRYWWYILDLWWNKLNNLHWEEVISLQWDDINKIQTKWD